MTAYPREELEEMARRWVEVNDRAEALGDWTILEEFYTDDAEYGYNVGPKYDFLAVGRDRIRDWILKNEQDGLQGWRYPFETYVIDEKKGEIVFFWKQVAPGKQPDGSSYEIAGVGGSYCRYAGDFKWSWMRDFFDVANGQACFRELEQAGLLNDTMKERLMRTKGRPGFNRRHPSADGGISGLQR